MKILAEWKCDRTLSHFRVVLKDLVEGPVVELKGVGGKWMEVEPETHARSLMDRVVDLTTKLKVLNVTVLKHTQ